MQGKKGECSWFWNQHFSTCKDTHYFSEQLGGGWGEWVQLENQRISSLKLKKSVRFNNVFYKSEALSLCLRWKGQVIDNSVHFKKRLIKHDYRDGCGTQLKYMHLHLCCWLNLRFQCKIRGVLTYPRKWTIHGQLQNHRLFSTIKPAWSRTEFFPNRLS